MIAMHSFPLECNISDFYPYFISTMQRRLDRILCLIKHSKNIYFLCNRNDEIESFLRFAKNIHKHFNIYIYIYLIYVIAIFIYAKSTQTTILLYTIYTLMIPMITIINSHGKEISECGIKYLVYSNSINLILLIIFNMKIII